MNVEELEALLDDDSALVPPDPRRDAVSLSLVMCEPGDDADEVAEQILSHYTLNVDALKLMTALAALVAHGRDDTDELLFELACELARETPKGER